MTLLIAGEKREGCGLRYGLSPGWQHRMALLLPHTSFWLLCSSRWSILHTRWHTDWRGTVHLCKVWSVHLMAKLQIRLVRQGMPWLVLALCGQTLLGKERWIVSVLCVRGSTESINTAGTEQTDCDITKQDWLSIYILMCLCICLLLSAWGGVACVCILLLTIAYFSAAHIAACH